MYIQLHSVIFRGRYRGMANTCAGAKDKSLLVLIRKYKLLFYSPMAVVCRTSRSTSDLFHVNILRFFIHYTFT